MAGTAAKLEPNIGSTWPTGCIASAKCMSPKIAKMAIVAQDVAEPSEEDGCENHLRSQDLFQMVMRHRGIKAYHRVPWILGGVDEPDRQRADFALHILEQLRQRGVHSLRTFRVHLHLMDLNRDGTCLARPFAGALSRLGIRLKEWQFDQLCDLFSVGRRELLNYAFFVAHGCSNWSERREEVVREAFEFLGDMCPGRLLSLETLQSQFRSEALTPALVPNLVEHDRAGEFFQQWDDSMLEADGVIRWQDFLDYYMDVSTTFSLDAEFCKFVCDSWNIDMDDWVAKKIFRSFATGDDENVLQAKDFIRMLDAFDSTITEEEALACYEVIDEDGSGDVSLTEFLDSKVLRVKSLFDRFDTDRSRTVSQSEMVAILQSISPAITVDEAAALYHSANLKGTGEITFAGFLGNNLLKMLQIFDSFVRSRTRTISETEMRLLLRRKVDPHMDDYDIHVIFKSIDTDRSGSISFVEFVESHVLRVKSLFDKYDINKSGSLTRFKFCELLGDMDSSLTHEEVDAIYKLVAGSEEKKVTFVNFMTLNIVKLKLLFDKYDVNRNRVLHKSEFCAMLQELFKLAPQKDVEKLAEVCSPKGGWTGVTTDRGMPGITLAEYIQAYRDIFRSYEVIELAMRKQQRQKQSK